jgi:hypothetical protein
VTGQRLVVYVVAAGGEPAVQLDVLGVREAPAVARDRPGRPVEPVALRQLRGRVIQVSGRQRLELAHDRQDLVRQPPPGLVSNGLETEPGLAAQRLPVGAERVRRIQPDSAGAALDIPLPPRPQHRQPVLQHPAVTGRDVAGRRQPGHAGAVGQRCDQPPVSHHVQQGARPGRPQHNHVGLEPDQPVAVAPGAGQVHEGGAGRIGRVQGDGRHGHDVLVAVLVGGG